MRQTGVVILAHGSRGQRGITEVPQVLQRIGTALKPFLPMETELIGATLQFNHPNLEEAVALLASKGIRRIVIAPYFLFPGQHITGHIPALINHLESIYPQMEIIQAKTLELDEHFITQIATNIGEAAPDLLPSYRISKASPEAIERQSMEIVSSLINPLPNMSDEELEVTKRVVHASGDSQIARLIRFSPSAISIATKALSGGRPIVTDVRMVKAGINGRLLERCGCHLITALDTVGEITPETRNGTKTAAAMQRLRTTLNDAVVVIGNAPTALLALIDMVDHQEAKPAFVVGMPVGFVQAKEAKEALMKRDVPYITVVGTRGGSAMAVATMNALLKIAMSTMVLEAFHDTKKAQ